MAAEARGGARERLDEVTVDGVAADRRVDRHGTRQPAARNRSAANRDPRAGAVRVSGDVGRYRRVRSRIWIEQWFLTLTEAERLVALYCLTGPPTNGLGLYRLVPEAAAADFHVSVQTFRRRFDAVCGAAGWRFDAEARVIWIPEWL